MTPEQIFDEAFARYERPLISYAREITGDLESARDTVQETFLRLSKQDIVSMETRMAPWLFFVCRNCAIDHCRKIVRFCEDALDDEQASEAPSPSMHAVASEEGARLRELLAGLPQSQRELVQLKFEAGLSYKEMAEAMRMSVSHVGVQLHEALHTLRRQWNQQPREIQRS